MTRARPAKYHLSCNYRYELATNIRLSDLHIKVIHSLGANPSLTIHLASQSGCTSSSIKPGFWHMISWVLADGTSDVSQPWWIDIVKVCHKPDHMHWILTLTHCFEDSNPVGQKLKNMHYISVFHCVTELQVKQAMLLAKSYILEDHVVFGLKFFSLLVKVLTRKLSCDYGL